jgi:hypothetical protein
MESKSLNAGAYVFTPGGSNDDSNNNESAPSTDTPTDTIETGTGAPLRDSFTEMVEGIDKVTIEDAGATPTSDVTTPPPLPNNTPAAKTSLPSHLAKHAAEFWFPECRDCSCCKGFKYGCNCAASNGGSCACVADDDVPVVATPPNNANSHQQQRYPSTSSGRGSHSHSHGGGRGGGGVGVGVGGGGRRKIPCRFFLSAQGCRFGDSCTFDHTSQG